MASIFIGNYHIDYSLIDGTVITFEKKDSKGYWTIIEDEQELLNLAKVIMQSFSKRPSRYSTFPAFIQKLITDKKIETAKPSGGEKDA